MEQSLRVERLSPGGFARQIKQNCQLLGSAFFFFPVSVEPKLAIPQPVYVY